MLRGWADYLRTAPDELTSVVGFANPLAGGPARRSPSTSSSTATTRSWAAGAIDPIRRLGPVLGDDVALTAYADTLVDGLFPAARPPVGHP